MRILVADHNPETRAALCTLLRFQTGVESVRGVATLDVISRSPGDDPVDTLLLDWSLMRESGTPLGVLVSRLEYRPIVIGVTPRSREQEAALAAWKALKRSSTDWPQRRSTGVIGCSRSS